MEQQFDLIIIGGGAAAFAGALKATEFGAHVAMVERGALGGTCVNVGCVPTKFMLSAGERLRLAKELPPYFADTGTLDKLTIDWSKLLARKNEIVMGERQAKYADVVAAYENITLIEGEAAFTSERTIMVGDRELTAERFLIASGSSASVPPLPGLETVPYLTNVEALELKKLPESMIVVGGRALGLEFAQVFSRLGSKVTLLQRGAQILTGAEPEITSELRRLLEDEGIEIATGVTTERVTGDADSVTVTADVEGTLKKFTAEKLLMATGRKPNTAALALDKAGVDVDRHGAIVVDARLSTSIGGIWAAGDVTGEPMLETVAAKAGSIAAHNAFSAAKKALDLSAVPRAVFTDPAVAGVGLTDAEVNAGGAVTCSCRTVPMSMVPKAKIIGDTRGLIKMVIDEQSRRIIGVHILSPLAHELIHEATLAVKFKLTTDDIIDTIHVFPTLSESIKLVAQSFTKDISKMSCCVE